MTSPVGVTKRDIYRGRVAYRRFYNLVSNVTMFMHNIGEYSTLSERHR